jgi:hypothetical protein
VPRGTRKPRQRASVGLSRDLFVEYVQQAVAQAGQLAHDGRALREVFARVEQAGGHKRAMRDALRLAGMEVAKRNDYLANLQTYCDWLGVWSQQAIWQEPRLAGQRLAAAPVSDASPVPDAWQDDREDERPLPFADENAEQRAARAEQMGRADGRAGLSPDGSGFAPGTELRDIYDRGWLAGQREVIEESETATPPQQARGRRRARRRTVSVEAEAVATEEAEGATNGRRGPRGTRGAPRGYRADLGAPPRTPPVRRRRSAPAAEVPAAE